MRSRAFPAVMLCCGLAACGEPAAPLSSGGDSFPVDSLLTAISAAEALGNSAPGSAGMIRGAIPPGASCSYNSASGWFECAERSSTLGTWRLSYQLLDASGQPQPAYVPGTVAAVRTVTDVSGTLAAGSTSIAHTSHSDRVLSGLLTGRPMVNGTGVSTQTMTSPMGTLQLTSTQTTTDLVLPRPGSRWPESGQISVEMQGSGYVSTITTLFNGTSQATLIMTTPSGTRTCIIDLEDPLSRFECFQEAWLASHAP